MAREDFLRYAESYSGVDGGDIDAEYWFMGMEWSDITDIKDHYDEKKDTWKIQTIESIKGVDIKKGAWKLEQQMDILYHMLMHGVSPDEKIFSSNSNTLKLNLLPLPFKGTSVHNKNWREYNYTNMTGFECFSQYKRGVIEARKRLFQELLQKNKMPKTIFCFGKTYQEDFLQALTGDRNLQANKIIKLEYFGKNVFVYNNVNPLIKKIIICYFPCPPGGKQFDETDWQKICDLAKE